ncbi:MAG: glycosyltransferase family 39 protein [Chloroflexaceae bacterium]|nr:glycosyltransferase family 39 protein [Chloroflexaceae bacterium]
MTDDTAPLTAFTSDAEEQPEPPEQPAAPLPAPEPLSPLLLQTYALGGMLLALAFGVAGQMVFMDRREFTWTGVILFFLAGVTFVIVGLLHTAANAAPAPNDPTPPAQQREPSPFEQRLIAFFSRLLQPLVGLALWRQLAVLGALLLTGGLLYIFQREPRLDDYNWTFGVWVAAMGLFVVAVAPPRHKSTLDWSALRAYGQQHAPLLAGIVAVLVAALVLRVWNIAIIPRTLGGDEAEQGWEAMKVLSGEIKHPFITGWLDVPTMSFYYTAIFIGTLGETIFALRVGWALIGVASIYTTFLLVRRLFDLRLAATTAGLLTGYHFHIHYSRLGSIQIADVLFVSLALWFLYRGYDQRSYRDWALCGITAGIAQYFYAGARLIVLLVIAVVLFLALRDILQYGWKVLRERYREAVVLFGAMLIAMAPVIQFAIRFPNNYNARVNMVGIFQNGWVEQEMEQRGVGVAALLIEQAQRSFLAFHAYSDRTFWYGTPDPLLDGFSGVLFGIGLIYGLFHAFDRRMFPMVAWWGGATILGGVLTMDPPASMRLVTLAAPVMFFVALALVKISEVVVGLIPATDPARQQRWQTSLLAGVVLFLGLINIRFYFQEYTPLRIYGNYNAVVATDLGMRAHTEFGADTRMYFFGPPRMYIGFGTIRYLAPDVEGVDFLDPITSLDDLGVVLPDKHAAFVFLPERISELDIVQARFPNGELIEIRSPVPSRSSEPLYFVYFVPREQVGTALPLRVGS